MKRIIILIGAAGIAAAALITNVAAAGIKYHAGIRW